MVRSVILLMIALPAFALASALLDPRMESCAAKLRTEAAHKLLVIVAGGRATGNRLSVVAKEMGFKTLHLYPASIPDGVKATFAEPHYFDFPDIVYNTPSEWSSIARRIMALADSEGLEVAGFIAGMDYGVEAANFLNHACLKPGNTPNSWRSHKGRLNEHLAGRNIPVARSRTLLFEEIAASLTASDFPLFMKPVNGYASIGAGACLTMEELPGCLARMRVESGRQRFNGGEVLIQDLLNRDTIYFVNTINAKIRNRQKRIVTGVAIDSRGDDFPKEVWDIAVLLPPPQFLRPSEQKLFDFLIRANHRVLENSDTTVGSSHLEFMSKKKSISHVDDLLPTDLNLRLPGLDWPRMELISTGMDPYILDIAAHTRPELLQDIPEVYSNWRRYTGLVFLRSHWKGKTSAEGITWLNTLLADPDARDDGAFLSKISMPQAGTPTVVTEDGSSMQGFVHIQAPTMVALWNLYREIREKERLRFFVDY